MTDWDVVLDVLREHDGEIWNVLQTGWGIEPRWVPIVGWHLWRLVF